MAVNTTPEERRDEMRENLIQSLKLESKFRRELVTYFDGLARTVTNQFSLTGSIPTMSQLMPLQNDNRNAVILMLILLAGHYQRVFNAFKNSTLRTLERANATITQSQALVLQQDSNAVEIQLLTNRPQTQNQLIQETNQKEINEAIETSTLQLQAELQQGGPTVTQATIAAAAVEILRKRARIRADTISVFETTATSALVQDAQLQATILAGVTIDGQSLHQTAEKRWTTMLDNLVRPAHVLAEGQIQPIQSPYTVGGELLMHPKDTSLGATLGNVMYCRCNSLIIVQ